MGKEQSLSNAEVLSSLTFRRVEADHTPVKEFAGRLNSHVFGQEHASLKLAKSVMRSKAEMSQDNQPMGIFFFLGPTGVGKTEMSKALAKEMSTPTEDWQDRYVHVDCTELQEKHQISKLTGSPQGYIGYGNDTLIMPEMLEKGAVVCFDEIEKAHPALFKWLLPVFSEGKTKVPLKNPNSGYVEPTVLDFSRSMIVLTSNVGAEQIQNKLKGKGSLGFSAQKEAQPVNTTEVGLEALKDYFKQMPEFLGRIGAEQVIAFNQLGQKEYVKIFDSYLKKINENQKQDPHPILITDEAKEYIIKKAVNPELGARDLISTIKNSLLSLAADIKISGVLSENAPIVAVLEKDTEGKEEVAMYTSGLHEQDAKELPHYTAVQASVEVDDEVNEVKTHEEIKPSITVFENPIADENYDDDVKKNCSINFEVYVPGASTSTVVRLENVPMYLPQEPKSNS